MDALCRVEWQLSCVAHEERRGEEVSEWKGFHKNESPQNSCSLYFWKQNTLISAVTSRNIFRNIKKKAELFLTLNLYFGVKVVESTHSPEICIWGTDELAKLNCPLVWVCIGYSGIFEYVCLWNGNSFRMYPSHQRPLTPASPQRSGKRTVVRTLVDDGFIFKKLYHIQALYFAKTKCECIPYIWFCHL